MSVSPRYYLFCFVLVLVLTVIISWIRQNRTRKEFFLVMASVAGGVVGAIALLAGIVQLLVWLGIAESGFTL